MKKVLIFIYLIFIVLVLTSCNIEIIKSSYEAKQINTETNAILFPEGRNDLHQNELNEFFYDYALTNNLYLDARGEYHIYNHISIENSQKYQLDVFEVCFQNETFYFVKHKEKLYQLSQIINSIWNHGITNIAITDINGDNNIEILVSIFLSNEKKENSNIYVIDSNSQYCVYVYNYDKIGYFKENEEGIISIYNLENKIPTEEDINEGCLDRKYYDYATVLYSVPELNTAKYEFKEYKTTASCNLYSVELTIDDKLLYFPYLFETSSRGPRFNINVKMTYLGETFTYTSPHSGIMCASVSFVDGNNTIVPEGIGYFTIVCTHEMYTGRIVEMDYIYNDNLIYGLNKTGYYDMIISCKNENDNIVYSIVIENFLKLYR